MIKSRDGTELKLKVAAKPSIAALVKASLTDIKEGSFVGVTSMPQPDGGLSALEVHIFPEAMHGTGEGHYPWDLRPQSTMTNANVEQVGATVDGRTLTLKYKDGEKKIFVPADTPIVIYELGDRAGSRPAPRSSSSPSSSPTERSRVVRGASAAMAQRRPSDRVGFLQQDGLHPGLPGGAHRVSPVGPSIGSLRCQRIRCSTAARMFGALHKYPRPLGRRPRTYRRNGGLGGCWWNIVPRRGANHPDELRPSGLRRQEHER